MLNSPAAYIHGRDRYYRPILLVNIPYIDLIRNHLDDYLDMAIFLCHYMT
jgi:hypothetical protein